MISPHIVRKTTSPTSAPPEAGIHWINTTSNTAYFSVGTTSVDDWVAVQGSDSLKVTCKNITGSTIPIGSVVYINGASGNLPTIALAKADTDATSSRTFGITSAAIANNATGEVVAYGNLKNINTSAFTEGVQLYLSPTVAGALTATKPSGPNHIVSVAICTRSHPTLGVLVIAIKNGFELEELHDVSITSVADGQIIKYEAASSLWKNVDPNYASKSGDTLQNEYLIQNDASGLFPLTLQNKKDTELSALSIIDSTSSTALIVGVINNAAPAPSPLGAYDGYITTAYNLGIDYGNSLYFSIGGAAAASIDNSGYFTANTIDSRPIVILDSANDPAPDKRSSILMTDYTTGINKSVKLQDMPVSDPVAAKFVDMNSPIYHNYSPSSVLTGTVTETILYSFTINGGFFDSTDWMTLKNMMVKKTGALASANYVLRVNSTNSFASSTVIMTVSTTTGLAMNLTRRYSISGGTMYYVPSTGVDDFVVSNTALNTYAYNVSNTYYFWISGKLNNVADSIQIMGVQLDRK